MTRLLKARGRARSVSQPRAAEQAGAEAEDTASARAFRKIQAQILWAPGALLWTGAVIGVCGFAAMTYAPGLWTELGPAGGSGASAARVEGPVSTAKPRLDAEQTRQVRADGRMGKRDLRDAAGRQLGGRLNSVQAALDRVGVTRLARSAGRARSDDDGQHPAPRRAMTLRHLDLPMQKRVTPNKRCGYRSGAVDGPPNRDRAARHVPTPLHRHVDPGGRLSHRRSGSVTVYSTRLDWRPYSSPKMRRAGSARHGRGEERMFFTSRQANGAGTSSAISSASAPMGIADPSTAGRSSTGRPRAANSICSRTCDRSIFGELQGRGSLILPMTP